MKDYKFLAAGNHDDELCSKCGGIGIRWQTYDPKTRKVEICDCSAGKMKAEFFGKKEGQ